MSPQATSAYQFGQFRLDLENRLLMHSGQVVPLTPKVFEVLVILVENSPRVVDKEELMKKVWPNTFVEEANLTQYVFTLRKALGDGRDGQTYIKTIPRRGYRFVAPVRAVSETRAGGTKRRAPAASLSPRELETASVRRAAPINSLLVLPFVNAGSGSDSEYLSDGITEGIINSLARLPHLRVIARGTAFRYKGREVDYRQVGRELSVRAVLEGRVIERNDELIIKAELTDIENSWQLWGEHYHRPVSDISLVQDEIAKNISEKLHLRLSGEDEMRLSKHHTEVAEAYKLYLKGRYCWNKYTQEGIKQGIDYFWQAIDADPSYALAYAGLADCYYRLSNAYLPPSEAMPKARAAAIKALEIDDSLAEAHATVGLVKMFHEWDWPYAQRAFERAIQLKPGSALVHQRYGLYLDVMQRFDEARAEFELAQSLDPLSVQISASLSGSFYFERQFDEAIAQAHKALGMNQNFYPALMLLGMGYEQQGKFNEADAAFQKAKAVADTPIILGYLGHLYALSGRSEMARQVLAELDAYTGPEYVSPYGKALIYAGLGELDKTFECLETAYQDKTEWLCWLNIDPRLDSIRSDARFTDLRRRLGLAR